MDHGDLRIPSETGYAAGERDLSEYLASSETRGQSADTMIDWHRLGISELQSAYSRGEVSPTAVLDHYLERIARFNGELKAFVDIDEAGARKAAAQSAARFDADNHRPLEGIIIGIKANIAVAGLELNAGMKAREGIVAQEDAYAVDRLRNAGAIILGTLNMHEAAAGATTNNPYFGACLNPYGSMATPGGSSGGSASAVAAGLCQAALGTDTLGSIRIPAAYCGIYGLKPTHGTINTQGLVPLSERFDSIGPMARSMDDLSILTNVLFTPDLATAMRRSRMLELAELGSVQCESGVLEAFRAAVAELPDRQGMIAFKHSAERIRTAAFLIAMRDLIPHLVDLGEARCNDLSEEMVRLIDFAMSRSEDDQREDAAIVAESAEHLLNEIGSNGVLVVPTAPQVAFEQGRRAPNNQADFTALANIAGLCAISLPAGLDSKGMPIGLQLIGAPGSEAMLIAQARMINDRIRGYTPPTRFW
jgi:aspartyl-tRNA(Asn)/glutamyl-tRNA(Gln) amidotransferase subunit A